MRARIALTLLLASPAAADGYYTGWTALDGTSCCDESDCAPAVWSIGEDGVACVRMPDGQCIPEPYDREIPVNHPDGRAHICARQAYPHGPWFVLCWTPGRGT
jgi:hypothetical protein